MTLSELFELYERKRLRGKSANTIRLYRHTIRSFEKFLKRTATVNDFDGDLIEDHMWQIVKRGGSPASANKDRSQLIALWKFAAERRIVDKFPQVQPMREPEHVPLGWMPDELARLFKSASMEPLPIGDVPGNLWFTALLRVLADTGERIGALRALKRDALQGNFLLVPAEVRKGKTRDRLYPLNADTVQAVQRLQKSHEDELLFCWPYSQTYFYKRYDAILRRAKLPTDRRSKAHRVRRTVASAVARAGGDATAALDHASPKTTKKYLDPRIVGGVQVSEILAAYLSDPTLRQDKDRRNKDAS